MPLMMMCGYPCSGKSVLVTSLEEELRKRLPDLKITVVSDTTLIGDDQKCEIFSDSKKEREFRAHHKSEIERALTQGVDTLVIMDSSNYIKGYRYELYCLAKSLRHQHMIVYCDVPTEQVIDWNDKIHRYTQDLLNDIISRFEPPNPATRWDQPILTAYPHLWSNDSDDLGNLVTSIIAILTNHQQTPVQPNRSTVAPTTLSSDSIQEIDRVIQQVIDHITQSISTGVSFVRLPKELTSKDYEAGQIQLLGQERQFTPANLARIKRRYISIQRSYLPKASQYNQFSIAQGFFQYLSAQSVQE